MCLRMLWRSTCKQLLFCILEEIQFILFKSHCVNFFYIYQCVCLFWIDLICLNFVCKIGDDNAFASSVSVVSNLTYSFFNVFVNHKL